MLIFSLTLSVKGSDMLKKLLPYLFVLSFTISGCAINPVTGEKEFNFVSQEAELKIGAEQYAPSRQMQEDSDQSRFVDRAAE
jgi:hypothetical protein